MTPFDAVEAFVAAHGIESAPKCTVVLVGLKGSPPTNGSSGTLPIWPNISREIAGRARPPDDNLDRAPAERLEENRRLLEELRGTLVEVKAADVASGLIRVARRAGASQVVIGSRRNSRLGCRLKRSRVEEMLRAAGDLAVQAVNVGRPDKASENRSTGASMRSARLAATSDGSETADPTWQGQRPATECGPPGPAPEPELCASAT